MVRGYGVSSSVKEIIILIAFLLGVILLLPYLLKILIKSTAGNAIDLVKETATEISEAAEEKISDVYTKTGAAASGLKYSELSPTILEAMRQKGISYYGGYSLDPLESVPILAKPLVYLGNLITPTEILTQATEAGYSTGQIIIQARPPLRPDQIAWYNSLSPSERLVWNTIEAAKAKLYSWSPF